MGFSRQGLIDQLMFEEFPEQDAIYAVDFLNVDWNEQAVRKAKSYMETMSFFQPGLVEQLEFEGFTPEQAQYRIN